MTRNHLVAIPQQVSRHRQPVIFAISSYCSWHLLSFFLSIIVVYVSESVSSFTISNIPSTTTPFYTTATPTTTTTTTTTTPTSSTFSTRSIRHHRFGNNLHGRSLPSLHSIPSPWDLVETSIPLDSDHSQQPHHHDNDNSNSTSNSNSNSKLHEKYDLQVILIDHYDSYTWNLYDMIASLCTHPPRLVSKDQPCDSSQPSSLSFDALILSPGPGRPSCATDMGHTLEWIQLASYQRNIHDNNEYGRNMHNNNDNHTTTIPNIIPTPIPIPILGVCLGHQALAYYHGATVKECPIPIHGHVHEIQLFHTTDTTMTDCRDHSLYQQQALQHNNNNNNRQKQHNANTFHSILWEGITNNQTTAATATTTTPPTTTIPVTRYHSLGVYDLPDSLMVTALYTPPPPTMTANTSTTTATITPIDNPESSSSIVMAFQHETLPHYGVQFHPESIGTPHGRRIVQNFLKHCVEVKKEKQLQQLQQLQQQQPLLSIHEPIQPQKWKQGDMERLASSSTSVPFLPKSSSSSSPITVKPSFTYQVTIQTLTDIHVSTEQAFQRLYSNQHGIHHRHDPSDNRVNGAATTASTQSSHPPPPPAVWLDSSLQQQRQRQEGQQTTKTANDCDFDRNNDGHHNDMTRYSIMAGMTGPQSRRIDYYGTEHEQSKQGVYVTYLNGTQEIQSGTILEYLEQYHQHHPPSMQLLFTNTTPEFKSLPFVGGHIGYLGYDVRHDTQRELDRQIQVSHKQQQHEQQQMSSSSSISQPISTGCSSTMGRCTKTNPHIPTAAFLFCDQSIVYDHDKNIWYLIELTIPTVSTFGNSSLSGSRSSQWLSQTEQALRALRPTKTTESTRIQELSLVPSSSESSSSVSSSLAPSRLPWIPNRSKSIYQANIDQCHEHIRLGESYELCLTNQLETTILDSSCRTTTQAAEGVTTETTTTTSNPSERLDTFSLYQILRQKNPAPFAAYLNFQSEFQDAKDNDDSPSSSSSSSRVTICCSSPERFVSVCPSYTTDDEMIVEAKPIKGTAARPPRIGNAIKYDDRKRQRLQLQDEGLFQEGDGTVVVVVTEDDDDDVDDDTDAAIALALQNSVKNRAENLMIVDLLRNDLHRVCQTGTVHVPKLMSIESYATVHQMVSTIRGTLDSNKTALDVLIACFPGGSMTGAPKRRTMELLHEMEEGVSRGPYSGCLGYMSVHGRMDMNIIIRSIVLTPVAEEEDEENGFTTSPDTNIKGWKVSIGAGGAITALSDSEDEYEEMLLKARAIKESVDLWAATR